MKYEKNKVRLDKVVSAMQGFYLLVKIGLVFIHIPKVYRNTPSSILLRKIFSFHFLYFSFEKHVPSQVLKDFYVENLETPPSTCLSKFSSEIYLSRIINYWGSNLHYNVRSVQFSLCSIRIRIYFFEGSANSLTESYFTRKLRPG